MAKRVFLFAIAVSALPAFGGMTSNLDVRDYIISAGGGGSYAQTGAEPWTFRRGGFNGALLTADPTGLAGVFPGGWNSPGMQFSTPAAGYLTTTGSSGGTSVPASFDGVFVHAGNGITATMVYTVQQGDTIAGAVFSGELPFNGASGNGMGMTVGVVQGGMLENVTRIEFSAAAPVSNANVDLSGYQLSAGDRLVFDFDDNGSYLFDQGNVSLALTVPAPGSAAALAVLGMAATRRRRALA